MIHIIITSYKEPKATIKAVNSILSQKIKGDFKIIVVEPFEYVISEIKSAVRSNKVGFFLDPGEGKSYALNLLLEQIYSKNTEDIIVSTDGDVYLGEHALSALLKRFEDKKVGCVTGRPVSTDPRETKYGYWSKVLFAGADMIRRKLESSGKFFECSGYLFAIRNGVITSFPLETSEDSIIPYLFWERGYKIEYARDAEVFVKTTSTFKDWVNQRVRNIKAHENLNKIAPNLPRTKSFFNEIKEGTFFVLKQPKNLKEWIWTFELFLARLYIYLKAFKELKQKRSYADGWRETEIASTRPMD